MQPAHRLGAQTGEVVVTVRQQPQHHGVVIARDGAQTGMAQRRDGRRQRVVRVVLRCDLPEPNNRTLADSVGGTSMTCSPAATSCWASR